LNDFKRAYYPGGEFIRDDPDELYAGDEPLRFVNIPIIAWLFAPFTLMSVDTAGALMTALGIAAVVASFAALVWFAGLSGERALLLAGAFVISGPLYYSLREGNTSHVVLLMLIGMAFCVRSRRYGWAGVFLAAATLIKPPLGLIALPFVMRERWSFIATFAMTGALAGGLSLALYGLDLHRDWYDYSVRPYSEHPLGAENVQSLDGVLARFWTDDYLDRFVPIESLGAGFRTLRTAIAGMILVGAGYVMWRGRRTNASAELVDACTALCLALLLAPTSWTHYYLLLLLPVGLMIAGTLGLPWTRLRLAAAIAGVVLISPPVIFIDPDYPILEWLVPRVLISHYFFGGVVILGLLLESRWRLGRRQDEEQRALADEVASSRPSATAVASRSV
ncbi:MAG: glycosyltransferase family 87 protein, partial [Dehalococcoidia bacterium]